jgi:hypothetical protein
MGTGCGTKNAELHTSRSEMNVVPAWILEDL